MPANVDPNVYAMSIQMQLDSGDALDTLNEFSDSVTDVEQKVSDAATKAIGSIQNVATSVNDALKDSLKTSESINSTSLDIEKAFSMIGSHLDEMGDPTTEELETLQEAFDVLEDWIKTVEKKNLLHEKEKDMLEEEQDIVKSILGDLGDVAQEIGKSVKAVYAVVGAFSKVMETIAKANDIQEQFVENNYRLYGSMDGIAADVRGLGREYGALEKEAVQAYKALADVRTPREEIDKMTKNLVQMNRVTGVGMQTLAEYTKQLRGVGGTAATTELHLNRMQDMMRKAGLSADQMNKILSNSEASMQELTALFGNREGAEYFQETKVAAAGMAQQLGFNAEAASKQLDLLATDIGTVALMAGRAGMEIPKTAEETEKVFIAASIAASKEYDAIQNSNLSLAEKQARMEALRASYGFHNKQALEASAALGREIERRRAAGEAIGNMQDLYDKVNKSMEENFDATQRFARSWADLKEAVGGIFREFFNLIGIILVPMIKWLTRAANAIAAVIGFFVKLYDAARNLPILGWLIKWGEEIVGLFLAIAFVIVLVVVAFAGLASVGSMITSVWSGAGSMMTGIGNAMVNVANAIGRAIVAVFQAIGNALRALGQAVQPVMVPLIALGFAFLLTGIGAWFFAMAIDQIVQTGWAAIPAFIGLAIGLVILGLVLIWLGGMIQGPIAIGMLILAVVMLAIGAAAWLMGAGLLMAAQAFEMIHDAIGPHSPPMWVALPLVAAGLLLVAAAALLGAPGLLVLAVVLFIVAIAAWMLAPAFVAIVKSMEGLDAEVVMNVGYGLVIGAALFLAAAAIMLVAAALLLPAAAMLAASMAILALAAPLTITVGAQLAIGGALMFVGSVLMLAASIILLPAAVIIFVSGALILMGAIMLMMGLPLIIAAAALMMIAGPALIVGAILFAIGAFFLSGAAATIYENGILVGAGGQALLAGTQAVLAAADLIGDAGGALDDALDALGEAIENLDTDAINTLYQVSILLAMAGMWLMIGSIGLYVGAIILVMAAQVMLGGAESVAQAATLMLPASEQFIQVGFNFMIAGELMYYGAYQIMAATAALFVAVFGLFVLTPILIMVGFELIFGAILIYISGLILMAAADMMIQASTQMVLASSFIMEAAELLWWSGLSLMMAGPMLAYGSLQVIMATWLLIEAAFMLTIAGRWLVPAAMSIWTGMWWLDSALMRFKNTIPVIEKVGAAVFKLAQSLDLMRNAPFDSLQKTARDGLAAIPMLDKFAAQLPSVAERMASATEKFKKPASELAQVLNTLGDAILKFDGVGQNLAAEMESVSNTLDEYSYRLEAASQRIQTAVESKAIPAMASADNAGIEEAVKSEAITQVQVTTDTEGAEAAADEQTEAMFSQVQLLQALDEKLALLVASGPSGEVGEILALLNAYLPEMATRRGGLSSEMNSWMK